MPSINDVHPLMDSILMKICQIAYARRISTFEFHLHTHTERHTDTQIHRHTDTQTDKFSFLPDFFTEEIFFQFLFFGACFYLVWDVGWDRMSIPASYLQNPTMRLRELIICSSHNTSSVHWHYYCDCHKTNHN
jgi:hypothetical protein